MILHGHLFKTVSGHLYWSRFLGTLKSVASHQYEIPVGQYNRYMYRSCPHALHHDRNHCRKLTQSRVYGHIGLVHRNQAAISEYWFRNASNPYLNNWTARKNLPTTIATALNVGTRRFPENSERRHHLSTREPVCLTIISDHETRKDGIRSMRRLQEN